MSHRATLDTMTDSQINSRHMSLGAPRVVKKSLGGDGSRKSMGTRKSMATWNESNISIGRQSFAGGRKSLSQMSSRRSSVHGKATGTSDPRPLSDKGYRQQVIRLLIQFLSNSGYDGSLSPKLLSAPSQKDFIRMFQCIYRHIDPNWDSDAKPEEEIPNIFKELGYPFAVKKSTIFACGSAHNWPRLLGALQWLVELVGFIKESDPLKIAMHTFANDFDFERDSDQVMFLEYCEEVWAYLFGSLHSYKAYENFLTDEKSSDDLLEDLRQSFADRRRGLERVKEQLANENLKLKTEVRELEATSPPLETLKEQHRGLSEDSLKLQALMSDLESHIQKTENRLQTSRTEKREKHQQLESLKEEATKLKVLIANQEMSAVDVEELRAEQRQLDRDISAAAKRCQKAEQEAGAQELAVAKTREALERVINEFNRQAQKLAIAAQCKEMECYIELNMTVPEPHVELQSKMRKGYKCLMPELETMTHDIRPRLQGIQAHLSRGIQNLESKRFESEVELQHIEESSQIKRNELAVQQQEMQHVEKMLKDTQTALSAELKRQASTVGVVQDELSKLKMETMEIAIRSEEELEAMKLEVETAKAECIREQEEMNRMVLDAVRAAVSYKERVELEIAEINKLC